MREHFDDFFLLIILKGNLSLSSKTVTGLLKLYSAIRNTPQNVYFLNFSFFLFISVKKKTFVNLFNIKTETDREKNSY